MTILSSFAENLKHLRAERGWSQEELAERSGLHRTYISGLERGTRNPTLLVIERLAMALDVHEAVLLERRA
jgi:transcriptional regulator with XRE-family HTH domain